MLFAVIITLAVVIAGGPTKFFEARNVRDGVSCTVRHCADMSEDPDGRVWRRNEEMGH